MTSPDSPARPAWAAILGGHALNAETITEYDDRLGDTEYPAGTVCLLDLEPWGPDGCTSDAAVAARGWRDAEARATQYVEAARMAYYDDEGNTCEVCDGPIRYGIRHPRCGEAVMALESERDALALCVAALREALTACRGHDPACGFKIPVPDGKEPNVCNCPWRAWNGRIEAALAGAAPRDAAGD